MGVAKAVEHGGKWKIHKLPDNLKYEEKEVNMQEGKKEETQNDERSKLSSSSETLTASKPKNIEA